MPTLTDQSVKQARAAQKRREIPDALLPGLYLVVQPSGTKSWAVRYRHNGRPTKHTIGSYPAIKLGGVKIPGTARALASTALQAVAEGRNPNFEKQERRRRTKAGLDQTDLFATVYADYEKRHIHGKRRKDGRLGLKPSTARTLKHRFNRHILPRWKKRRLNEITKADVIGLITDVADKSPIAANRTFECARHFFNWCVGRGIIEISPCMGVKKPTEENHRDRVLGDDEIRWLWKACGEVGYPFGPMTKLLLLTGSRREEARSLVDSELDLRNALWTIPGLRTKNGLDHEIALSDMALAILATALRVRNGADYRFSTNGVTAASGFSRAKDRIDSLMRKHAQEEARKRGDNPAKVKIDPWRIHDLRRSVASGMARLGIALPVIEKCLNHISGSFSGIVGVYQKHKFSEEKRAAFEAWSDHVASLVGEKPSAKVLPMRRKKTLRR